MPKPSKLSRPKVQVWRAESIPSRLPGRDAPAMSDPPQDTGPATQQAATVQSRMGVTDIPAPAADPATAAASDEPARKRTLKQIHSELSEIADKREPGTDARLRLEEIVSEASRLVSKGPSYQRLYERALRIQRKAMIIRPSGKGRIGGGPAGLVENPGLSRGGHEVLGGLPSSRRRY